MSSKIKIPPEVARKLIRRAQPSWIAPMLATLTEMRFSDPNWIFEPKLDGVRALAFKNGTNVQLLSRNKKIQNHFYPEIVEDLQKQSVQRFILDGEVVTFDKGVTSFAKLQHRMGLQNPTKLIQKQVPVFYYVFDLLYLEGYDTTQLGVLDRKNFLKQFVQFNGTIKFTKHRIKEGEKFYAEACRDRWEGIVAKRADSTYVSRRTMDWLKFKCSQQQEFVIGGYTDPEGARTGFGALLVGYYSNANLLYAGKVGTGYNEQTLRSLLKRLQALERKNPTFQTLGLPRKGVHWVEPKLVAQVAFSEWTSDDKLRHPRFLGLREDKNPREVVRE